MFKVAIFLFLSIYLVEAKHEEYDGHSLYEVGVNSEKQITQIQDIVENLNLDIWSHGFPDRKGLILVAKHLKETFENALKFHEMEFNIVSPNIRLDLELEDKLLAEASRKSNGSEYSWSHPRLSFDAIHRYAEVDKYLEDIANRFPEVARVVTAGRSFEGRDIKYLRISSSDFKDSNKPIVFVQSLLHAREWITLPVTLYAIEKLVVDVTEQDLVRDLDWIILPIANPDGYEFSHTNSRMWRKNRATGYSIFCIGVDLNRNHDFNWGTGSSNSPCSDTFHGNAPFSEPETQVTMNIFEEFQSRMSLFLDIHSFGSMILFGYGNGTLAPNALILNLVGVQMAQRIDSLKWPEKPNYRVGNIVHVIGYSGSGGSSDYAQIMMGSGLSYTYELPAYRNMASSVNGFLVDPAFIYQAAFETWEGIKEAARYVARR